ncbi:MAG: DUF429 domain-containing protein [Ardenticatenia bacterium]|nr:DUF429 domain-containing protein [Ardenticatenia bacterium]
MSRSLFIGWDVGGWNCDHNARSRDAIVILDEELRIVGVPWRGNLRESINAAATSGDWIAALARLCGLEPPADACVTLAIDTPLGFPAAFLALGSALHPVGPVEESRANPYLYRHTERLLFNGNVGPLSAIKDMIGSQATKGMHVLAKFAPRIERCGVWTDDAGLRVIETYPAACRRADADKGALASLTPLKHDDLNDARVCALVASLFATAPDAFAGPPQGVPIREGWIWVPKGGKLQELLTGRTRLVKPEAAHA